MPFLFVGNTTDDSAATDRWSSANRPHPGWNPESSNRGRALVVGITPSAARSPETPDPHW